MMNPTPAEQFNIPVSYLRQFHFCRRIPFFMLVRGLQPPRGNWVTNGVDIHRHVERLLKRRDLSYRLETTSSYTLKTEVSLHNTKIGLHGICDAVLIFPDEIIPIEIKTGANRPTHKDKIQLCAYALLIENQFNKPVQRGFLLFETIGEYKELIFSKQLRDQVLATADAIRKDCNLALLPFSSATDMQCAQCEFSNFCADRF